MGKGQIPPPPLGSEDGKAFLLNGLFTDLWPFQRQVAPCRSTRKLGHIQSADVNWMLSTCQARLQVLEDLLQFLASVPFLTECRTFPQDDPF